MKLNSRTLENGVTVIECLEENLDASNVRAFRESMQAMMKGQSCIAFNMSHMKFVDSSGLGALISCLREANSHQGDFRLCALTPSVSALIELMRLHRVFSILESEQAAIDSFA